jgi:HK97 family phage major capsid protein
MTAMPTATQLATRLHEERSAIAKLFDERKQPDGTYNFSAEEVANLRKRNEELAELQKQYDEVAALEGMHREVKGGAPAGRAVDPEQPEPVPGVKVRSFGDILAAGGAVLKRIAEGGTGTASFEISGAEWKTLLTSADITAQADRQPIQPSAQFLADVTPLFQPGSTESSSIDYYLETTFTNNAAEVDEGTANTDSALDFTLTTDSVREINVWLPVARNTLADVAQLQSYVTGRLRHMLNTRRSAQLIAGDGSAPNIRGVLNRSGIQTQAKGADPVMDAIHKAITKVAVTGDSTPDAIVLHPNDWQDIRLTRTVDGVYILGNPGDAGARVLWGLPVTVTTSITENTGLVGAFGSQAQLFRREGVTVEVSTEHASYFTERKVAVLLYERLALAVYRPSGFCSVTGI